MIFSEALERARRDPRDSIAAIRLAELALETGEEAVAVPLLDAAARATPRHARIWQWGALLHRALDDRVAGMSALARAALLAPHDKSIAHGLARVTMEAGLPAVSLFEAAQRLAPQDGDVLLGLAAARVAAGDAVTAIARLDELLAANPGWTAGHHDLAHLRWMMGDRTGFAASIERALLAAPRDVVLWQTLIIMLIQAECFDEALDAITRARTAIGNIPFLDANEGVVYSETGAAAAADAAFARVADIRDVTLGVRVIRHLLRTGRVDFALPLIEPWLECPEAGLVWPYAAAAWRIAGDPRLAWLERDDALVSVFDLADTLPPLDGLATLLRGLHNARNQHLDQSVRGGTQTDGILLARVEPEIRALRRAILVAVQTHIAGLPPPDPRHPTLRARRDRVPRFNGSWSVRLSGGGGHHSNHTHPAGWLSSALYVALPQPDPDRPHAGWLTLGAPQAELALDLPPTRLIEPRPGRLVLFPSTMWHGTAPFASGERMTVAFDIAYPL